MSVATRAAPAKSPAPRRAADSAERAYRAIRQQLVEFRMRPDERINEVQLAQALALSRTPVREALNRLASEGFVVLSPNRGFHFRGLDIDELVDLFEMRSIIETGAFILSCERASGAAIVDLEAFWEAALKRYANNDRDEIIELDEAFHVRLAECARNPEVVRQLLSINARIRFIRRVQIEKGPQHRSLVGDHSRIVQALARRDPETGTEVLRNHISLTFAEAQSVLKEALKVYAPSASPP